MADKEPPLNSKSDSSPGSGSTTDEEGKTSENSPSSKEPSPIGDSQAASKGKPSGRRKKWFQRVFPSEAVRVGIYLSFSAACIFICLWQAWLGLTSLPEIPSVVLVAPYFLVAFACALFSFWLPLSHLSYTGLYDVRLLMVPTELYEQLKKGSVDDGALRFFHGKHRFPRFPALILTLVVFAQWLIVLLCFFVVFGILYATDELTNHTIEWLQTIANIETIFQSQFPLALSVSVFIITTLTAFATILKVRWHRGRLMVVGRDISFLLWRFQCGKKIQAQDCVLPAQNKEFSEVIHQHELWVESGGYQGERAHFSSAKLPGYDFGDLNLSSARFSMCDLTASNFSGTHLQNAEFDNNDLSYANFRHTNLSHASMSGSSNLRTLRLGGANLSGATLPPSISFDETLKGVEENTKSASDIFKLMLAACLISWVTLSTSPDWRLIDSSGRSALPLINTEVPLAGFYVVAPISLFGFYVYFHL